MNGSSLCHQEQQMEHAKRKKQKRDAAFTPAPETTTPSKPASLVKRGLLLMRVKVNYE